MTSEMIIAALRSGADHLDSKPSVTNTFYGSLMRDSADRISDVEKMYSTKTARITELERENIALNETTRKHVAAYYEMSAENAALRKTIDDLREQLCNRNAENVALRKALEFAVTAYKEDEWPDILAANLYEVSCVARDALARKEAQP